MEYDYIKSKKILLVDDESELLQMVEDIFRQAGFQNLLTAATCREAVRIAREEKPDLAVLDVMLPDGDGFGLLQSIRAFTDIPVIYLTAKDEAEDKYSGLGLGADDYLVKPFLPKELLLRTSAVLRRCYKEEQAAVRLHSCLVDFGRAEVVREQTRIPLTAKEYALLEVLIRNANRIVTIDALCEAVWGDNPFGYENSLMAHIRRIREKIEENPSKPESLITVKGLGYKMILEGR